MSRTVSVVIPAWNAADTLERALDSIAAQTVLPAEIIVVDDGSTDASAATVRAWSAAHPEVPLSCLQQPNGGPGAARNRGVEEASGDWIALLDADDRWLPRKLERQLATLDEHPELTVLAALRRSGLRGPLRGVVPWPLSRLLVVNLMNTSSVLIDRAAFAAHGGFTVDQPCSEDYDLWLRLAAEGAHLAVLWEPLVVCGEGKSTFGEDGLSGDLWGMERGELANLRRLRAAGTLGRGGWAAASAWSLLKFQRRLLITRLRRR